MEPSSTAPSPVMDYRQPDTAAGRSPITLRIVVFLVAICVIVGWLGMVTYNAVYQHIETTTENGVEFAKVNLKAMSSFPFDQRFGTIDDVPKDYRALDGKKVILVGEMWAPNAAGLTVQNFDLVYSIAKCCFSGPPQVQHFVKTTSSANDPMPYFAGQVRVKGTLKVQVVKDDEGKITAVYHLAAESIDPI